MAIRDFFEVSKRYRTWSMILIGIGILSIIVGFLLYGTGDEHHQKRFWASLLHNSVYFLLVCNAAMFFICATTLAMGGWQLSFGRVTEAISIAVVPLGIITCVILVCLVTVDPHMYEWLHPDNDKILLGKSGFLSRGFFLVWTFLTIGLWIFFGYRMRQLSRELDNSPLPNPEAGKRYIFKSTVRASVFIVWFALTVMSVTPWLWLMSLTPHWYSTMYSWYNFASTFVSGLALITLFVVYLKNNDYLPYTNEEHLHDLGKFMFAFSIFWAYLWFAQYMLIWYANIPEETIYFKPRIKAAPYSGIFWFMFIVNFVAPLLILMTRGAKRNYTTITFMAVLILVGHWLDFYQQVFAAVLPDHVELNLFDFGVAAGFVGVIMYTVGNALAKYPLAPRNHPFFKETVIHHT